MNKPINKWTSPGQVAQLDKASSWYSKVVGSVPGQGIQESTNKSYIIKA